MTVCKICGSKSEPLFVKQILKKYTSNFYKCEACGFMQTDEPVWLAEAYTEAISGMDTGILVRNGKFAKIVPVIISAYFNSKAKFLDYGAGYGILVRMMRDRGYNFYWQDEYCTNLFAKKFDISLLPPDDNSNFEVLTAFEVFEHLADPVTEVKKMLEFSDSILFSTDLVPKAPVDTLQDWWYLSPETGQHISFYSLSSLTILGKKFGLNLYSDGHSFHLFTRKKINPYFFQILNVVRQAKNIINATKKIPGYMADRESYK